MQTSSRSFRYRVFGSVIFRYTYGSFCLMETIHGELLKSILPNTDILFRSYLFLITIFIVIVTLQYNSYLLILIVLQVAYMRIYDNNILKRSLSQGIGVLKNFEKLAVKQLCWSLFFNNVTGLRQLLYIDAKKGTPRNCFVSNVETPECKTLRKNNPCKVFL